MDTGIIVTDKSNPWRFDPEVLKPLLSARWPEIDLRPKSRAADCSWYIDLPNSTHRFLNGFMAPGGKHIGLEAEEEDCIAFILWLRNLVPTQVELGLINYHDSDVFPLTSQTTAQAIRVFWQAFP